MGQVKIQIQEGVEQHAGYQNGGDEAGQTFDGGLGKIVFPAQDIAEGDEHQNGYNIIEEFFHGVLLLCAAKFSK
jgi:hypothetical protein